MGKREFNTSRLYADALLLLASLIWGTAFVPQRVATKHLGFFLFNGLRFLLGAAVLAPLLLRRPRPVKGLLGWSMVAGGALAAAAALQQAGIAHTTAGKAGFLTGLYVVLVPVVLLIGWRQRMSWRAWATALLAAIGAYLLREEGAELHLGRGESLVLAGAVLWALHIVLVGRAVARHDVLWFSVGQYLVAGILSTALGMATEASTLGGLAECWWAVAYCGILSIAVAYTLQAVGQRKAPAADAALILSMEAVFAALAGMALLSESMIARQYVGCAVILAAVVFSQIRPATKADPAPAAPGQ